MELREQMAWASEKRDGVSRSDVRLPRGGKESKDREAWQGRLFKTQPLLGKHFQRALLQRTIISTCVGALLVVMAWVGVAHYVGQPHQSAPATYVTANGQRATIVLPDGNTVLLNVASQLQVPASFMTGDHAVRLLSGEAMFTVSHHDRTPFTVITGSTVARVLGTTFLIRHYTEDTAITVAVRDGKVAVGATVVSAAQSVVVARAGVTHVVPVKASQFGFATGILVLRGLRLRQAIPELDRWYDADIRLGDASLGNLPIDGDVTAGSLGDLAERLRVAFNVRVVRSGRVLTLYPE